MAGSQEGSERLRHVKHHIVFDAVREERVQVEHMREARGNLIRRRM